MNDDSAFVVNNTRLDKDEKVQMHPFLCVQTYVYDRLRSIGGVEPRQIGRMYLSLDNIEYIFYEFLRRFEEETGAQVLPENQTMGDFAEMIVDTYFGMTDSFDHLRAPTSEDIVDNVMAWNKLTVDYFLVRALQGYNRQGNYIKRYKNYKYGAKLWDPVKPITKKTKRIETNLLQNYAAIGTTLGRPKYPVRDCI